MKWIGCVAVVLLLGVSLTASALAAEDTFVNLGSITDYTARFDAPDANGEVGESTISMGDVNSDGYEDVVVSQPEVSRVYLIYSRGGAWSGGENSNLGNSSTFGPDRALRIDGASSGDRFGYALAKGPDLSGDGLPELIISAPALDRNGTDVDVGRVYVIYSQTYRSITDNTISIGTIQAMSNWGYALTGTKTGATTATARFGASLGISSDINGDGLGEILTSDSDASTNGAGYVLWGKQRGSQSDSDLSSGWPSTTLGYELQGTATTAGETGQDITSIQDLNGDSLPEIVISDSNDTFSGRSSAGVVYIVYGQTASSTVALTSLATSAGYLIGGSSSGTGLGSASTSLADRHLAMQVTPDINGDGVSDIAVGQTSFSSNTGRLYVISMTRSRDLSTLGNIDLENSPASSGSGSWSGLIISGGTAGDRFGYLNSNFSDLNADGVIDIVAGAEGVQHNLSTTGASYVVLGRSTSGTVTVTGTASGGWGWPIFGGGSARLGASGASMGDYDRDGLNDLALGAPGTDANATNNGSLFYVVRHPVPTVTTNDATSLTNTTATLNGQINPKNFGSVSYHFELGTTSSYGLLNTTTRSFANASTTGSVSASIADLTPCTTYHYRLVGVSGIGFTRNGSDVTFTTTCVATAATTSTTTTTTPDEEASCELFKLASVRATSAKRSLGKKLSLQLSGPKGRYALRSTVKQFGLRLFGKGKSSALPSSQIRSAKFYIDGKAVKTIRKAPFAIKVNTKNMSYDVGRGKKHTAKVVVVGKSGVKRTLSLPFYVSKCTPARFAASLRKGALRKGSTASGEALLDLYSGKVSLGNSSIELAKALRLNTASGARTKPVGTVQLTVKNKRSKFTLKLPKGKSKKTMLLAKTKTGARVTLSSKNGRLSLAFTNLPARTTRIVTKLETGASVPLRIVQCGRQRFSARASDASTGGKITLASSPLQKCSG